MQSQITVVAHNIRSLGNVGSIFRSCDGAGVHDIILSGYTGAPPDPRIAKVALGVENTMPWRSVANHEALVAALADMYVIVLEQHESSVPAHELTIPEGANVALIVCEELFGADEEIVALADCFLELPMRGVKESLNVAVATGIATYAIAHSLWGTPLSSLASRQDRPPVRDGVLTRGVTTGETPQARA